MSVIDSYTTGQDDHTALSSAYYLKVSQSITGNGNALSQAEWYLRKIGSPTGSAYCKIYAYAGTHGVDARPTGDPLATSDPLDVSTIGTSFDWVSLHFDFPYTPANGVHYCLTLEYSGGNSSNYLQVGEDGSSPTHSGNWAASYGASWSTSSSVDFLFSAQTTDEAYTPAAASALAVTAGPTTIISESGHYLLIDDDDRLLVNDAGDKLLILPQPPPPDIPAPAGAKAGGADPTVVTSEAGVYLLADDNIRLLVNDAGDKILIAAPPPPAGPSPAVAVASAADPVVTGSLVISASASAQADTINPSVILGSIICSPALAGAVASAPDPAAITSEAGVYLLADDNIRLLVNDAGDKILIAAPPPPESPAPAIGLAGGAGPIIVLSSVTVVPVPAGAVARATMPVPLAPAEGIAASVDPEVIQGAVAHTPTASSAVASTSNPNIVLSSIAYVPAPALAGAGVIDPGVSGSLAIFPTAAIAVSGANLGGASAADGPQPLVWPEALPSRPLTQSYLERPSNPVLRSPMDAGPVKARPLRSWMPSNFTVAYQLNGDQVEILAQFYIDKCQGGAVQFGWPHPRTGDTIAVRFLETPSWQPYGEGKYIAMVRLETKLS